MDLQTGLRLVESLSQKLLTNKVPGTKLEVRTPINQHQTATPWSPAMTISHHQNVILALMTGPFVQHSQIA